MFDASHVIHVRMQKLLYIQQFAIAKHNDKTENGKRSIKFNKTTENLIFLLRSLGECDVLYMYYCTYDYIIGNFADDYRTKKVK